MVVSRRRRPHLPSAQWFARSSHVRNTPERMALYERCPGWFRHEVLDAHPVPLRAQDGAHEAVVQSFLAIVRSVPGANVQWAQLEQRAQARLDELFTAHWTHQRAHYEDSLNTEGDWTLDEAEYRAQAHTALRFHLCELSALLDQVHPHTGDALDDLFDLDVRHLACAWEYVRPIVHAARGVPEFPSSYAAPDKTFHAELDVVYNWTTQHRLIALHTSPQCAQSKAELVDRLVAWAYLAYQRGHDDLEGLEAWMLGDAQQVVLPSPDRQELYQFELKHHELLRQVIVARHQPEARVNLFPEEPRASWGAQHCSRCPAQSVCEVSGQADRALFSRLERRHPGCDWSSAAQGRILAISERRDCGTHEARVLSLATAKGACRITGEAEQVEAYVDQGLRIGAWVRLSQLEAGSAVSGAPSYFMSGAAQFEVLDLGKEEA